jgi:pimeloyl-ACP methyl ester carboxylesterase
MKSRRSCLLACIALAACGAPPSGAADEPTESSLEAHSLPLGLDLTGFRDAAAWEARASDRGPLQWKECPEGFRSECATVKVPIDWQHPRRGNIDVFMSRYPAAAVDRSQVRQLWLLAGGPGSAEIWEGQLDTVFAFWHQNYDIHVMEYRGIGDSTRLSCPVEEDDASDGGAAITEEEWPACIRSLKTQWGDELGDFTVTNVARDLKYLIHRTKLRERQDVFLYGHSFGTTIAQRFLQVAPAHVSGVMLDSVVSPDRSSTFDNRFQYDPVVRDLATLCDRDAVCGAKLGGNAWEFVRSTLAKLDDPNHCPGIRFDSLTFGDFASQLMVFRLPRVHVFPLLYRAARCSPEDVAAIAHYREVWDPGPPFLGRSSDALALNLAFSELVPRPPPSERVMRADCEKAAFCPAIILEQRRIYDIWPLYRLDPFAFRWPETRTPILAMNGDLDPSAPYPQAAAIRRVLRGPHQNYVQIPQATHFSVLQTAVKTPGQPTCGLQLMQSFTEAARQKPNTDCIDDIVPLSFAETQARAQRFFGQDDIWENAIPSGASVAR